MIRTLAFSLVMLRAATVLAAEPAKLPAYKERLDLTYYLDDAGQKQPIKTKADWERRRKQVVAGMAAVIGALPGETERVPLDVQVVAEEKIGPLVRRKLSYQSDSKDRVPAYLFLPEGKGPHPAALALHQTFRGGKDEPAGLAGNPDLHYALELAQRGYVTLAPDYPTFGEHKFDFRARPELYPSGTLKAVWDNIRATDLLVSIPEVDAARIGCIGHSLGGHNTVFTAVIEPRIKAFVSSCGFTTFTKDDVPSWTGPVYMPRIAALFGNDAARVPFDFPELIAAIAPRAMLATHARGDTDLVVDGAEDCIRAATSVYKLYEGAPAPEIFTFDGGHSFPPPARKVAYEFLDRHLKKK